MAGDQHPNPVDSATKPMTPESVERRMRGNTHVRCGERVGETDREKSRNRAPARLSIMGKANASAIVTLVERASRFVLLQRIPHDHSAERVAYALTSAMNRLPVVLKKSLTWDQGREMAQHATFTTLTGIPVFFCDPHSPWQRGTNENTNGLLREYFPKGMDLSGYGQDYLDAVARELNGRPRRTLDWLKPSEKLNAILLEAGDASTC
jgi:IS30 family transposase